MTPRNTITQHDLLQAYKVEKPESKLEAVPQVHVSFQISQLTDHADVTSFVYVAAGIELY